MRPETSVNSIDRPFQPGHWFWVRSKRGIWRFAAEGLRAGLAGLHANGKLTLARLAC